MSSGAAVSSIADMIAAQLAAQRKKQAASEAAEAAAAAAATLDDPLNSGASDKLFYDKLMELKRGNGQDGEAEVEIGTCKICGMAMAARRQIKTLPCGHVFHFGCIDSYHRDKLNKDKCVDMPCYICGAATNQSIASVAAEMRKKREAATAKIKAELAANPALAAELAVEVSSSARPMKPGLNSCDLRRDAAADVLQHSGNNMPCEGQSRQLSDAAADRKDENRSLVSSDRGRDQRHDETAMIKGAARRATSRRRAGGALAAMARAANHDEAQA